MIAEKFGEPIGKQNVGVGVPDERNLDEGAKDMKGKRCEKCRKGTYEETGLQDDWNGKLHCNKCKQEINRWKSD